MPAQPASVIGGHSHQCGGVSTMGVIVRFPVQRHARASSTAAGYKSGRRSDRETPVARSIGNTNSAGTPFFDRVSQYQTCDCVVPIRSASGFCPPATVQARLSASLLMESIAYPDLGQDQPKTLCEITKRKFGTSPTMRQPIDPIAFGRRVREKREDLGMSQAVLGKKSEISQSHIGFVESGRIKDPRKLAMDLAEPLRTTVDWLLYEKGARDTAPPPMTAAEFLEGYEKLDLEDREFMTGQLARLLSERKKKRKSS